MKYVVVLCDGMADFPVASLGDKTPLEKAYNPNMNYLAHNGLTGNMQTIYPDLPVGSIVANMAILGFDPYQYYPNGRASFEALAQGIHLKKNDIAFRCNLISIDEDHKITDFTSGNISDGEAKNIIIKLKLEDFDLEIFPGQSYRNIVVLRNCPIDVEDIITHEPHCNIGTDIQSVFPSGKTEEAQNLAIKLKEIMLSSIKQIKGLNKDFNSKADMLWLWSPSSYPELPKFRDLYQKKGGIIAAMDFLKGIGVSSQMKFEDIPNTNGYIDTSYENKLNYAVRFLEDRDFVYIHVNAPDEEGHNKDAAAKTKSIEYIDHRIIGPMMLHLEENYPDDYRIAVLPDHYTAVRDGHHYAHDIPFLVYGKGVKPDQAKCYTEEEIRHSKLQMKSTDFLKFFFNE